jgi:hypothetical protein
LRVNKLCRSDTRKPFREQYDGVDIDGVRGLFDAGLGMQNMG